MKAYKQNLMTKTGFKINKSYKGESIEEKINRALYNKEPISDTAPQIFTERKDGVNPNYNIRTDRFEIAAEEMSAAAKGHITKRMERIKPEGTKLDTTVKMTETGSTDKQNG